jgi:hypothetical protein
MRIRLQKCSLVKVETFCEKNDPAPSMAVCLSFVEVVNLEKFNIQYPSLDR